MGCHPKPIDELHHFSEGRLNHQPVMVYWMGQGFDEITMGGIIGDLTNHWGKKALNMAQSK